MNKNRPERYWVTLISLYSGSRLNEICQMNLSDIEEQDGIWVMNLINDPEDKNIKTQSGNRVVPLHPKLIDPGLLNYVTEIRNKNETKLFPNLKRSELSSYGSPISQWFGRYLKNLEIKKIRQEFPQFQTCSGQSPNIQTSLSTLYQRIGWALTRHNDNGCLWSKETIGGLTQ